MAENVCPINYSRQNVGVVAQLLLLNNDRLRKKLFMPIFADLRGSAASLKRRALFLVSQSRSRSRPLCERSETRQLIFRTALVRTRNSVACFAQWNVAYITRMKQLNLTSNRCTHFFVLVFAQIITLSLLLLLARRREYFYFHRSLSPSRILMVFS